MRWGRRRRRREPDLHRGGATVGQRHVPGARRRRRQSSKTNYATAAQAAAAGAGTTGGGGGGGGASAAGGAGGGAGGGLGVGAIAGIAGAAAGGLLVVQELTQSEPCTFSVSPTSFTVDGNGDLLFVEVNADPPECSPAEWTASSGTAFISVSPSSGSGRGFRDVDGGPRTDAIPDRQRDHRRTDGQCLAEPSQHPAMRKSDLVATPLRRIASVSGDSVAGSIFRTTPRVRRPHDRSL